MSKIMFFPKRYMLYFLSMVALCVFPGCTTDNTTIINTPNDTVKLTPYLTITSSLTQEIPTLVDNEYSGTSTSHTPAPTPMVYTIVENDTLTRIAYIYGVKLNDLIAANPGIDPNFLSIGITITIPISGSNSSNLIPPTPIPLTLQEPSCYSTKDDGLLCLVIVENTQPFDVENVSGQITLQTSSQDENRSIQVFSPLNILRAGESTILSGYFHPPIPQLFQTQLELNTVIPLPKNSERYLDIEIQNIQKELSPNQQEATIHGEFSISDDSLTANHVWIVTIALDAEGTPVGYRKWANSQPLNPGEKRDFRVNLYSLGPPINDIDLLIEAQP